MVSSMILFPAIDIKDGNCVRLVQGNFKQVKVYHADPITVAKKFKEQGAAVLHVVDLDGAREGSNVNGDVIERIVRETDLKVQIGGGIRDYGRIKYWLERGAWRVVLGTAALESLHFLQGALAVYGDSIVVSVDARDGYVATHGWKQVTEVRSFDFCQQLEGVGVKSIVYTDIKRDGMLEGPNLAAYEQLSQQTNLHIIASGGISSLEDLQKLKELNLYGVISGKALYEQKFTLKEGLHCLRDESSLV